jgi:hypothetical protein
MEIALNANADVDKLEKLMAMQERWDANNAKKLYFEALTNFQNKAPAIKKSKQAHNYKYAPLGDIIAQIKDALHACGLAYRFEQVHGDHIEVICVVTHIGGHSERTAMKADADSSGSKNIIQAAGSTVTYLQRYTLIGALGISTADEDMDGRIGNEVDWLAYMACIRDCFDEICEIKTSCANDDFAMAKQAWTDLPLDAKNLLWLAPTKGGILTTEERNVIKIGAKG